MLVRFWGTRGSIPVALTAADVRDKLAQALVQASGRTFATYEEAHAFASSELDFSITHTFGGHSPCVEIELPGANEYFVAGHASADPVPGKVLELMYVQVVGKTAPLKLIENRLRQRVAAARLRGG